MEAAGAPSALRRLYELGAVLARAGTTSEIGRRAVAAVAARFADAGVWVAEVRPDDGRVFTLHGTGETRQAKAPPISDERQLLLLRAVQESGSLWLATPDLVRAHLSAPAGAAAQVAALAVLPLATVAEPEVLGLIGLCFDRPRPQAGDDVEFLRLAGELVRQALKRVRVRPDEQDVRAELEAAGARAHRIGALAAKLAAALTVDDVAEVLASQVQEAVACDTFSLRQIVPADNVARAVRLGGAPLGYRERFGDVRLDLPSALADVASSRRPVFLASAHENHRLYGAEATVNYEAARIEGLARLPMLVEGELIGILSVGYWRRQSFPAEERLFLTTVADLAAQALGRAIRTERVRQLQDLADVALARLSLGELLADLEPRLELMLQASKVVLYLYDRPRMALVAGPDGADAALPVGRGVLGRAVTTRRRVVVEDTAAVTEVDLDEEWRRFGSLAVVPLLVDGQVIGALVVGRAKTGPFLSWDLEFIDLVSARVALAVDRSQAFETQRALATTLQAALLPPALPAVAGMEIAARYAAAGAGIEVGGDFYDVFALADGAWLAVIGDVRGRGPAAAAITGLIRYTVRAVAVEDAGPASVIRRLNAVLYAETGMEDFATVACVRFAPHPAGAHLTVASAGHCHPLIVRNAATPGVERLQLAGTVVGAFESVEVGEQSHELASGDVLVMHTDGLTDVSGGGGRYGEDRLVALLRTMTGRRAEQIVQDVHAAVLRHCGGLFTDDLAVIALGVPPAA